MDKNRSLAVSEMGMNDTCKLSKWVIQALLGDVPYIRIGYISRKKNKINNEHELLGVSQYRTEELQQLINLNFYNS